MNLTGNTILITGGTSGIGRALAENFYLRGNQVIIAGRRRHLLEQITSAYPGMRGMELDVADAANIASFATQIKTDYPKLNVLVNNAGISRKQDFLSDTADFEVTQSIIQTNVVSVLHLTSLLLPLLRQQHDSTIITTTSGLAFVPFAPFPTYCATKAFLHSWLQSLRYQLLDTSIKVLEIAPPYVQTELAGPQQANDPHAVPLSSFILEVMQLLAEPNPRSGEILVERVKELRFAEMQGNYDQTFADNNNRS